MTTVIVHIAITIFKQKEESICQWPWNAQNELVRI